MVVNFLSCTSQVGASRIHRGAEVLDPTNIGDPESFRITHARNGHDRILINDDRAYARSSMKCIRKIHVIDFVRARAAAAARAHDDFD
jgi:hypothetical protein